MAHQINSPHIDPVSTREAAERVLQAIVGSPSAALRDDQWRAISALVLEHRRVLVVQRTGWGKSAVYFVATALLRAAGAGPTVIVSPLLALMRNQVAAAARAGIRAVTLNSTNTDDWDSIFTSISVGEVDVLLVSPERLNNPSFRDQILPQLTDTAGLLVIDEAHCISDWGHDFRPDYRRIHTILHELRPDVPVLATTATANQRVTADVSEQLTTDQHRGDLAPLVLRGALARTSLRLGVVNEPDEQRRLAWLATALESIAGSGIVYVPTVGATIEVSDYLTQAGFEVLPYSGQTDATEREAAEDALLGNRVKALVATSALGMGFDKPDVSFVFHLGAPSAPVTYYQQVGRAGRAVDEAWGVLLPTPSDQALWSYFDAASFPSAHDVAQVLAALSTEVTQSVAKLEQSVDAKRSKVEMLLKILDVDGAARRVTGGWLGTGAPWVYDAERYARVAAARAGEQQQMLEYAQLSSCRMLFLRRALEDATLASEAEAPCGRCDVCTGQAVLPEVTREAIAQRLTASPAPVSVGVSIAPRRQWPSTQQPLTIGAIQVTKTTLPPELRCEPGLAVSRMDALGHGNAVRALFQGVSGASATGEQAPVEEVPVPLRFAMQEALQPWRGSVDAVVFIDSVTRPGLVAHIGGGTARILGVPLLGAVASVGQPTRRDVNSIQRLRGVAPRLHLGDLARPEHLAARGGFGSLQGLRLVLVDDFCESRWSLTVAGALLRHAGASSVRPFTLAQM